MGIFGELGPKFVFDYGGVNETEVLLDNWIEISDNTDVRTILQESEISAERYFISRGEFRDIEGKVHLFKYTDPLEKFNEIYQYKNKLVTFFQHRDRDPLQDSGGNPISFYIESIIPGNLTTLDYRDVLYIKFRSLKAVDPIKSTVLTPPPPLFEIESETLFARMTQEPDDILKGKINLLIKTLKDQGIWSLLDALWVFASLDQQSALLNWVGNFTNATKVGVPTFTANKGFTCINGSDASYINTNYNLSVNHVKYALNSASFGWRNSLHTTINRTDMGTGGLGMLLNSGYVDNSITGYLNGAGGGASGISNGGSSIGAWSMFRNANAVTIRKDKNQIYSGTGNPDTFFEAANVSIGRGISRQYHYAWIASYLTPIQADALYDALNTYLVSIGSVT